MRRIVKETLADGSMQYRVEKKTTLFGLTISDWHTDTYYVGEPGCSATVDAVFSTIEEAEIFVYGKPKSKRIVKREIL